MLMLSTGETLVELAILGMDRPAGAGAVVVEDVEDVVAAGGRWLWWVDDVEASTLLGDVRGWLLRRCFADR